MRGDASLARAAPQEPLGQVWRVAHTLSVVRQYLSELAWDAALRQRPSDKWIAG